MRGDWFEDVWIPPSGGLDEFDRKQVRNDYALLALLENGVLRGGSQFYVSTAHTDADVDQTLEAFRAAARVL